MTLRSIDWRAGMITFCLWVLSPHDGSRPAGIRSFKFSPLPGRQLVQTTTTQMQTLQLEHKCGQRDQIIDESEDAIGITTKPRAISVECWLARLFENKSSGAALKVLFLSQGKMADYQWATGSTTTVEVVQRTAVRKEESPLQKRVYMCRYRRHYARGA